MQNLENIKKKNYNSLQQHTNNNKGNKVLKKERQQLFLHISYDE